MIVIVIVIIIVIVTLISVAYFFGYIPETLPYALKDIKFDEMKRIDKEMAKVTNEQELYLTYYDDCKSLDPKNKIDKYSNRFPELLKKVNKLKTINGVCGKLKNSEVTKEQLQIVKDYRDEKISFEEMCKSSFIVGGNTFYLSSEEEQQCSELT